MPDETSRSVALAPIPDSMRLRKADEVRAHLESYSRLPFIEILDYMMGIVPNEMSLQEFADKHPDRWAGAISTFARISGFTEKTEVVGDINVHIHQMGDAQIQDRLAQLQAELVDLEKDDSGEYSPQGE
jgi:hypothetical protein